MSRKRPASEERSPLKRYQADEVCRATGRCKRNASGDPGVAVRITRDWTDFINNMKVEFDKSPQHLNAVNAKLDSLLKNVTVAYDVNACGEMLQKMEDFSRTMSVHRTTDEGFTVINNITKEAVTYPYDLRLKMRDLRHAFQETGHAFSVDMRRSYIVPFALDFDCKSCKTRACNATVTASLAYTIVDDICDALKAKLDRDTRDVCTVFKARNTCNLHVYFDLSVSIVLYHELVDLLVCSLPTHLLDKYAIDRVSTLALPFSAKRDAEPYAPLTNLRTYEEFTVASVRPFYDVPVCVIRQRDFSVHKIIGTVNATAREKSSSSCFLAWDADDYAQNAKKYLAVKLDYAVRLCDSINYHVRALKNNNAKFVAETNVNLETYLNESAFNAQRFYVSASKIRARDPVQTLVQREIDRLARKIAKFTYNVKDVSEENLYNYLLSFLVAANCGYAFYIVTAACLFVADSLPEVDDVKSAVVEFLCDVVACSEPFQERQLLNHVLRTVAKFDALPALESQIEGPTEWFAEISKQIKLDAARGDVLTLLTCGVDDQALRHNALVDYFQISCTLIKPVSERQTTYFYYKNGLYVECKESELMNRTTLMAKQLFKNGRQFLKRLQDSDEPEDERELAESAWMTYLTTAKSCKVKFNMYDYFICTESGVFNTLTGTYMSNTPLLYFRTRKSYCTLPRHNVDSNALNAALLDQYDAYGRLLGRVIDEQDALFYLAIAVPGLLLLDDTLYNETLSTDVIKYFSKRVLGDTNERNEARLYYMMPAVLYYRFDVDAVMRVCRLLATTVARSGDVEIAHLRHTYESTKESIKLDDDGAFDYTIVGDTQNFINEMKRVYGRAFNAKYFVICHLMCAFDHFSAAPFLKTQLGVVRRPADRYMRTPVEYTNSSAADTFLLEPFVRADYRTNAELNYRRAFTTLFGPTGETVMNLLSSYSAVFEFDSETLDDFFTFLSMIYYPANMRKFLMLLIGSPKCGKTTVQHLLRYSNEPSTFGTDTVFGGGGGGGPSPDLIQIFSTYLTNIVEVRRIDAETLKVLTGGDHVNKRGCHQNEFRELQPLSFAIGVANEMPGMNNADEAIRERLAIFMMSNRYIDACELRDAAYEDNPLVLYAGHITVKTRTFNIRESAREFSNLLYAQYERKRNARGVVIPRLVNRVSRRATEDFLVKNNYVYDIMRKSDIVFHEDLQITVDDMQYVVANQIARYNDERVSGKKLTWETFKRKVAVLFANYKLFDDITYRGFGFASALRAENSFGDRVLVPSAGDRVELIQLRRHLQNVCNMSSSALQKAVTEYVKNPTYDSATRTFIGMKLRNA